jgi:hypothetical protein
MCKSPDQSEWVNQVAELAKANAATWGSDTADALPRMQQSPQKLEEITRSG